MIIIEGFLVVAQILLLVLKACDVGNLVAFTWADPVLYSPLMICAGFIILQIIAYFIGKNED